MLHPREHKTSQLPLKGEATPRNQIGLYISISSLNHNEEKQYLKQTPLVYI